MYVVWVFVSIIIIVIIIIGTICVVK